MTIKRTVEYAVISIIAVGIGMLSGAEAEAITQTAHKSAITAPPESFGPFYKKYVSANGFPIVSSEKVSDCALLEAAYIINQMLSDRPDIRNALIENKVRCVVMAPTEMTTDIPEHSDLGPKQYWDNRARGLGATKKRPAVSCGEENLLNYPGDRYVGENILVHEFAHTIHERGLIYVDRDFDERLRRLYERAVERGLWKDTYAASSHKEYWAEGVQCWFDCNREKAEPDGIHNHVNTREELEIYDPNLAQLIAEVFRSSEWRYRKPSEREQPAFKHLEQLKDRVETLKSYQAQVEYQFRQPLLESESLRKGVLYYQRFNGRSKLRMNFQTLKQDDEKEQKYAEHFIFDGIWLMRIDYQIKTVERRQLAEPNEPVDAFDLAGRHLPIIGFTRIEDLKEQFEIKLIEQEKDKEDKFIQLHLKVKSDSIYKDDYTSIDFWIDRDLYLPAKIVAVTTEEDIYQIQLLKPKVDRKIDKRVFEFKIPEGFSTEEIPLEKKAK